MTTAEIIHLWDYYIDSLRTYGARVGTGENSIELTTDFYHQAIEDCRKGMCQNIVYDLTVPDIEEVLGIAIWHDGHVDCGCKEWLQRCAEQVRH